MSRYSKKQQTSPETHDESVKIAKAMQRPGQTKEQTKLIAQGIQKGVELYKKQQKERSRELNKKLKQVSKKIHQFDESGEHDQQLEARENNRHCYLARALLLLSWIGFIVYFLFVG